MKKILSINVPRMRLLAMLLLRIHLIYLACFTIAGCVNHQASGHSHNNLSTGRTEQDCSRFVQPYSLRDYTIQGVRVSQIDPHIYGPNAQEVAHSAIEKAELINRQLDEWKEKAGACFGKGEYGQQIADKYLWAKKEVLVKKNEIEVKLSKLNAENDILIAEEASFQEWQREHKDCLVRKIGGMELEIVWIAMRDIFGHPAMNTEIHIQATNNTNSKILMPRNSKVWGFDNGSDVGGQRPIGVYLSDSFGNEYKLTSIIPSFLGSEAKGIRPGETVTFKIRFGAVPLQNAKSVHLKVGSFTLGQQGSADFEIPIEAFYYGK